MEKHENDFNAIILAAGRGTRMASPLPKVLHPVAGIPMIHHVLKACAEVNINEVRIVVGYGQNLVRKVVEPLGAVCCEQTEQKGTADAVRAAKPEDLQGTVLILNGDHPLIESQDLKNFISEFNDIRADLGVVTAEVKNPAEFGRIVRHKGDLHSIVEAKDASADTLKICEINTGIYLVKAEVLNEFLPQIQNQNSKSEYYLTDLVSLCIENRKKVIAIKGHAKVSLGVNNQAELAKATKMMFKRKAHSLMESGVVIIDPSRTYIESDVKVGKATVIYPGAYLRAGTQIGDYCVIEPNAFIYKCRIGDSVQIRAGSYLENSVIMSKATIGPYARLRPETEIGEEAHVGNFVEMKKVKFGSKSKAGHLTYLGDAEVGEETNIGCGTITCNYATDHKKYKTKIGSRVFVGSDSQFVAPVDVGDDAVIASGSTITEDVPAKSLAIARGRQVNKENYQVKKESSDSKE